MLFDPTERNVDPFLFPTGIRTMKKLVLTSDIHDKSVTMAETAQVSLIIRTGPTPPSEDSGATKTHRNDELGITELSKQRFVIAVPTNTRPPSPVKVQVRGGRHVPLSTPRLHQGCDGPPYTSKQWPAPLSRVRPWSGALPVRIRTGAQGITGDHPRCVERQLPYPVSNCVKGRKIFFPWRAPRNNHTPEPNVFSNRDQPNMFLIILPGPSDSGE